jgi:hypothetical protein
MIPHFRTGIDLYLWIAEYISLQAFGRAVIYEFYKETYEMQRYLLFAATSTNPKSSPIT